MAEYAKHLSTVRVTVDGCEVVCTRIVSEISGIVIVPCYCDRFSEVPYCHKVGNPAFRLRNYRGEWSQTCMICHRLKNCEIRNTFFQKSGKGGTGSV